MKKTDDTKLITVGQLVKELEGYEKKHWDWNVEITAEGVEGEEDPTCIITGMGLDGEGDLRIEIEEEWAGGGDYYVGELLEQLRDFDAGTRMYLAGGGLLFSIDNQGGIFAETDDNDDTLICHATAFGEYEVEMPVTIKKVASKERIGLIVLAVMAAAALFGLCYSFYTLVAHTGRPAWESILAIITCVIVLVVSGGTLYYSKKK